MSENWSEWKRTALVRACCLKKGIGNDVQGVAGTLWAAYNGIAEMVDHGRNRRTPSQHLEHIWFRHRLHAEGAGVRSCEGVDGGVTSLKGMVTRGVTPAPPSP